MRDRKLAAAILAAIACYLEQESPARPSPWAEAGRRQQWLGRSPNLWPAIASFPNLAWSLTQQGPLAGERREVL